MLRILAGAVFGAAAMAAVFLLWLVPHTRENYRAIGFNDGHITARDEIASAIEREVGRDVAQGESERPYETLFEVKASTVAVVERDGVKTVRVFR